MQKPFDVELFKNNLRTTWLGSEFIYIDKVDSTNSWLKKIPSEELVHGMVLAARHQTAGRGQYQRSWHATSGLNLTFTIGLCPPDGDRLTLLTLAAAFAVSETLEAFTEKSVLLKWPNDIVIGSKKVGGILTECMFFGHKPDRVLLGIGINLSENEFPENLSDSVISMSEVSKETIVMEKLLAEILFQVELIYQDWHKHSSELHNRVSRKLIGYGEWVTMKVNGEILPGKFKFLGINQKGELLALNEELDVNTFAHEQVRIITDQS